MFIFDRGGQRGKQQLTQLNEVRWERVRDDISNASLKITGASCYAQADLLNSLEPGRHEIAVFRGADRVWEGPITRFTYGRTGIQIHAKDVMHYVYRTALHAGYSSAHPNTERAVSRAGRILRAELARKEALNPPINVVPYITEHHFPNEAMTSTVTKPYESNVWAHIDKLAEDRGIDYTVVGRAIHLWDTSRSLGRTPTTTDLDYLGELYVSIYGMELATRTVVSNEEGGYGIAGGIDPYYGEVEVVYRPYSEDEGASPTQAEMNAQAIRNLDGRNPTPLQVRIPDNSTLNPKGVLGVEHLVPGVYIPLLVDMMGRKLSQMQKLNKVAFTETSKGEEIKIALYPAGTADAEIQL